MRSHRQRLFREFPVSERTDLVFQGYGSSVAGWWPGWRTMRCACHHRAIFGVSGGWRGRGLAVYLYPRIGFR